jgi:glycosyltransferase involved in cell wall biosynthesis
MISIIIPAYNGARFLDSALSTIRGQEFVDIETLLMDDGSEEKLNPPTWVRYFRLEHRGQSAARNRGIHESRGEFLAFLDIDDLWAPGHLTRLHAVFEAHADARIVQGRMRQLQGGRISDPYRMPYLGSCLFRREVFESCGGFDETMTLGEDHDLMYRCWENDVVKLHVDEVSLIYRRHEGNTSRGNNVRSHVMVLKRRIDRIRTGVLNPVEERRFGFRDYIGETEGASQWSDWSAS